MTTIMVTGGAGFVGSNLCAHLAKVMPSAHIIALDNLKRRGSELNVSRLQKLGVEFVHGDVRNKSDLGCVDTLDWLIECSAEPSVHAGNEGGLDYLMDTNLQGAIHCLDLAKAKNAKVIFLSSSRVYPIESLKAIPLEPKDNQFKVIGDGLGWSNDGISENFPMDGARSLYGSTKLSAELFIQEYIASYHLDAVVNRCGVIAGPWQMGKVDQGFVSLWLARHLWGGELSYFGFGGEGLQVRDVLHVADLADLIVTQMECMDDIKGQTFNVGGGAANSVSLCNLTHMVKQLTENEIEIKRVQETKAVDIPYYVTDNSKISKQLNWQPQRDMSKVLVDGLEWLNQYEDSVRGIFGL